MTECGFQILEVIPRRGQAGRLVRDATSAARLGAVLGQPRELRHLALLQINTAALPVLVDVLEFKEFKLN